MIAKKKTNPKTYASRHPEKPTSYDTFQPETDTPQEVRESVEPSAQFVEKCGADANAPGCGADDNPEGASQ
jgi:hypothetical protein